MNPRLQIALLSFLLACCAPLAAQDPADPDESVTEAVEEARDEPVADAAAEDGAATDPGALVEEDARVAASAEDEFNPDEEISEDYPVPLPSDI